MKKLFCILSLVFGLLSMILGAVHIVLVLIDLHENLNSEKQSILEKIKKTLLFFAAATACSLYRAQELTLCPQAAYKASFLSKKDIALRRSRSNGFRK